MEKDLVIKNLDLCNLKNIINIYYTSFSKNNRFSLLNLGYNLLRKRAQCFILMNEKKAVAFIYIIHYENISFILYLAVNQNKRNAQYGSFLLNWYLNTTQNKKIYLNIDYINKKYADNDIRIKRLNFYLKNRFYLTDYFCIGTDMSHILSTEKNFDINEYIKLDTKISKWFFTTKDKIIYKEN